MVFCFLYISVCVVGDVGLFLNVVFCLLYISVCVVGDVGLEKFDVLDRWEFVLSMLGWLLYFSLSMIMEEVFLKFCCL